MSNLNLTWQKNITLKDGKEIILRYPQSKDIDSMLAFVHQMVDEDTFIALNKKMSYEEELDYLTTIIKKIRKGTEIHVAAYDGERYLGSVGIKAMESREDHVGNFGISVLSEFRGLGLGKTLAQEAISQAKEILGKKLLVLWHYEPNQVARSLYDTLGFIESGRVPKAILYRGEYLDKILMYKPL